MSCYFRHLKDILAAAGIVVTPANRKAVDEAFHRVTGVGYKDCPATWKKLKQDLAGDEVARQRLAKRLLAELNKAAR